MAVAVELQEPIGWVEIPLEHINAELVRTFLKQIARATCSRAATRTCAR